MTSSDLGTGPPGPVPRQLLEGDSDRALFHNPVVGVRIGTVADGGRILRANGVYQRMVGYSEEELRQKTSLDVTHPDDAPRYRELFDELVSGRRDFFQLEKRYLRRDGAILWGRLTVYPFPKRSGSAPTHTIGLVEDITDRKRVEQERFASARRLEALLAASVDAILTIDAHGIIESANAATEKMFGYSAAELVGENVKVLMPSPDRERHDGYIERYLETGEKRIIGIGREVEGRRKDGSVFPADLAVSEVRIGDELVFMGTIRDLTDRKLLEESLFRAQKMEAIGRLAGGVAHDFNTLLGTITGYAELLRNAVGQEASTLGSYAQRIHQAARRGADLTRQLLTFSRRQEVRPRLVDVEALTEETADMIRRLIGEDIRFEHPVERSLGRVVIDPGQLQQVLLNLAVNASDAMPRGGRLTIRWARAELDRETVTEAGPLRAGAYAVLEVEDTGTGMDEVTLKRIFEPFFTTKETGKGTGLGLSTVFGIVRQWNGGISVASRPGAGTSFRLWFPEAGAEEPPSAAPPEVEADPVSVPVSATVLVVEDDAMFRALMAEVLEAEGYRVLTASEPAEARRVCSGRLEAIDLLVSDLVMPGGNGVELASELRGRYPALRVILMTGYSGDALASRDLDEVHAEGFLEKPFDVSTLQRMVRSVLS